MLIIYFPEHENDTSKPVNPLGSSTESDEDDSLKPVNTKKPVNPLDSSSESDKEVMVRKTKSKPSNPLDDSDDEEGGENDRKRKSAKDENSRFKFLSNPTNKSKTVF